MKHFQEVSFQKVPSEVTTREGFEVKGFKLKWQIEKVFVLQLKQGLNGSPVIHSLDCAREELRDDQFGKA
jgi:hypothetical protein